MASAPVRSSLSLRAWFWLSSLVEAGIVAASIVYVVAASFVALVVWEALAAVYLSVGLVVVWRGRPIGPLPDRESVKFHTQATWILPLVSSLAGINSAVIALIVRSGGTRDDAPLALIASLGVVLSWTLLHAGFAQIYAIVDLKHEPVLHFPGDSPRTFLDYLYYSFTVGTSFATSDVQVLTLRGRRVLLVHGVVSFFYNALVVAVAFQVLQYLVSS